MAVPLALASWALAGLLAPPPQEPPVDFLRDVRPILADRCFHCHGTDARARKAELRLDTWEGLTQAREHGQPVVPGAPDRSLLMARITAGDPGERMPPPASGLALSPAEVALLRRWIAEGAPFAPHWAFAPPRRAPPPAVPAEAWIENDVDRFVAAALARRGLSPSPPADRETLIRRVSLDLSGLPPTPEETDAFLADAAPGAYERVVDRLLASPRLGERLALPWLDAARYADTNGFHHDNVRTAWPYREWVIRAFNDNLPYDRFVVEQLAGDLLESATEQQLIASGFCRMHNINDEGGALDEEYRVEAVCDRIETISTALMGLTMACARCHDHKYDPLTQEDYYSLYAYFNSVEERGVYPNDGEQARAYPARLAYRTADLAARLAAAEAERDAARATLAAAQPAVDRERGAWEERLRQQLGVEWVDAELVSATSAEGARAEPLADGSVRFAGAPATDSLVLELRTEARGLRLLRLEALPDAAMQGRVGLAENGNAVVTAVEVVAQSVRDPELRTEVAWTWAWADHEQQNSDHGVHNLLAPGAGDWALEGHGRAEPRNALLVAAEPFGFDGGTVVRVTIACRSRYARHVVGRPRVSLARASGDVLAAFPAVAGDWWVAAPFTGGDYEAVYQRAFGPETVARLERGASFGEVGWRHRPDLVDGAAHALSGERSAFYLAREIHTPVPRALALSLGSDDGLRVFANGEEVLANDARRAVAPDQHRVEVALRAGANLLVLKVVNDGGPAGVYCSAVAAEGGGRLAAAALIPQERRGEALARAFAVEWAAAHSPTFARLDAERRAREAAVVALESEAVPVLVMRELPQPTPTHVLARGRYDAPDPSRPVGRRPPLWLGGEPEDGAPRDRLGFARWLVRPDHPLTARVRVNRLWQMLFGTGIVASAEDFGQQSDWPSHLELLDWLAVRFAESGFDQKALLRLLVTSATYRQSAVVQPDARRVDPSNRLLAYFPRRRLSGEAIRDQALLASGLLVERLGGPSVKPYQPPGLWREVSIGASSNTQVFERDAGDALYRRSLYTFWKRTAPSPQMQLFDAPTREYCVVRRTTTNTPLQALALWNDEQMLEAARVLAQRTLAEAADDDARLDRLFRRCTGRRPGERELAVLRGALAGFVERYRADVPAAEALLRQGEAPLPAARGAAELAAWTMVASAVLNLDETLVCD